MTETAIPTQPSAPVTALPKKTKSARQSVEGTRAPLQCRQAAHETGRCRIVLTGGPGGGKRTAADVFRRKIGGRMDIVPESGVVAPYSDDWDAAVKKLIAQVFATCRTKRRKIGICGEALGNYPKLAQLLVKQGIDSISLIPVSVRKTTLVILKAEGSMG